MRYIKSTIFILIICLQSIFSCEIQAEKVSHTCAPLIGMGNNAGTIDRNNFNQECINQLIIRNINKERKKVNVAPLQYDATLVKAAKLQTEYMGTHDIMTHYQKQNPTLYGPGNRVAHVGGRYNAVGENVIQNYIYNRVLLSNTNNDVRYITTYDELAEVLTQQWVGSPGHYKNLISKSFNRTGVSVNVYQDNKKVYGTQVFGRLSN